MFEIPPNEHVMIHVKLKNIFSQNKIDNYLEYTNLIIEKIKSFKPKSIVVPVFTYSFTKNRKFSLVKANSEVGRFSEEIRTQYSSKLRTLDPVFSALDILNYGFVDKKWNLEAFGEESIWKKWDDLNGLILNINLEKIVSTQFHFIEKSSNVPYRYDKNFEGQVFLSNNNFSNIEYKYLVGDTRINYDLNRDKILADMINNNIANEFLWRTTKVRWFRARDARKLLHSKISLDPLYMISK